MKTLIVYFSQTGNTRQVAEAIGRGVASADGAAGADVRPLGEVGPRDWLDYDAVGLGAPVFYYKEPVNVRRWIEALEPRPAPAPMLTFHTNGGNPCNTLRRLQKFLGRKGGRVLASFECYGYDTYPIYMKSFRQWGHPDAADLARAEAFGRETAGLAARFLRGEPGPEAAYKFVGGRVFRLSLLCRGPILNTFFPKLDLHEDLCVRCGACARACPTQNIAMDPGPRFADRCIHCYLCERICPQNAIWCDWRRLTAAMNP